MFWGCFKLHLGLKTFGFVQNSLDSLFPCILQHSKIKLETLSKQIGGFQRIQQAQRNGNAFQPNNLWNLNVPDQMIHVFQPDLWSLNAFFNQTMCEPEYVQQMIPASQPRGLCFSTRGHVNPRYFSTRGLVHIWNPSANVAAKSGDDLVNASVHFEHYAAPIQARARNHFWLMDITCPHTLALGQILAAQMWHCWHACFARIEPEGRSTRRE